jgi:hypothetical protein
MLLNFDVEWVALPHCIEEELISISAQRLAFLSDLFCCFLQHLLADVGN